MSNKYKSVAHMVKAGDLEAMKSYFNTNEEALERIKQFNEQGSRDIDKLLQVAIQNQIENNLDIINYLVDNGANINLSNHNGTTFLMLAAESNNDNVISLLLKNKDIDLHKVDGVMKSAIHYAVLNNAVKAFDVLFATGEFDINSLTPLTENTFLHLAASGGHVDMCNRLIELKIDPTIENSIDGVLASEMIPEVNLDLEDNDPSKQASIQLAEQMDNLFETIETYRTNFKKTSNAFDF